MLGLFRLLLVARDDEVIDHRRVAARQRPAFKILGEAFGGNAGFCPGIEHALAVGFIRAPGRGLHEGGGDALGQVGVLLLELLGHENGRVGAEDRFVVLRGIDDLDDAALFEIEIFLAAEGRIDIAGYRAPPSNRLWSS